MKMELQWLDRDLGSLDGMYVTCLKWFGTKCTSGIRFGLVFAENALFWAEVGVFVLKGV